jgi:23S rRNA (pseudouridine1915-N3)-methyltransferase
LQKIDGDLWLLDEHGERMNSHEFSFFLGQARDAGRPLTFILGGAFGFSADFKKEIAHRMRLSDMTLPHELCRVLFLEQLYRGFEIMKGSGYQH